MSADFGHLLRSFEADPHADRSVAWLRLSAGVLGGGAAALTLLGALPLPAFLIALTGLVVSLFWLRSSTRRLARAKAVEHRLRLHERGLILEQGGTRQEVPYAEVSDIEVDEERLDVVVRLRKGAVLRIEPGYHAVSIDELATALRNASAGKSDV